MPGRRSPSLARRAADTLGLALWCLLVWILLTWTVTAEQYAFGVGISIAVALALAPLGPVAAPWRLVYRWPVQGGGHGVLQVESGLIGNARPGREPGHALVH